MISYKYKLYRTKHTRHLDNMLSEACFVWNHALSLQKRYYRLYGKYVSSARMQKHFRDVHAAEMILRRGIYELASNGKTIEPLGFEAVAFEPRIPLL